MKFRFRLCVTILVLCINCTLLAQENSYPTEAVVAMLIDPLPTACDENEEKISKLPKKECSKRLRKALKECRKLIVSDKKDTIPKEEVTFLIGRLFLCKSDLLSGQEYSNEKADQMAKDIGVVK